jgi:gamma-glutamyltranspeptidase / glutathione hydrolase
MKTANIFLFSVIGIVLFQVISIAADRLTGRMFTTRSEVIATHGMVASSQPLATAVGLEILKKGGSAVDAAIAVNACLGLMEPTGSGIGGDLFAIVWDAKMHRLYGLNSSGPAPLALSLETFQQKGLKKVPERGPMSWTVPGCVAGWFELHDRFGKIPMSEILKPAIEYGINGFPLSELISFYWKRSVVLFKEYENFQKLYAPGGFSPGKGDIFKNLELAHSYQMLAEKGRNSFYQGEIAKTIVDYSKKNSGYFQLNDFATFKPEWVEPIAVNYRGYDVWELPPNSQGIAALQMLKMLSHFDLKAMGHNSADYLHTLTEIKKIVYEDRARFYADPRFSDIPYMTLISDEYIEKRLKLFNMERSNDSISAGDPVINKGDTVYFTVVDSKFNAISIIQSNYMGFGSGMVPDGLGFCLQDRGALFSLDKNHPNVVAPGKRPFHTIIPGFVTKNGAPVFSFGVMGGDIQPQGHVQILCNIIDFGMNIQEAGDAPRFKHNGSSEVDGSIMTDGGTLFLESGIPMETVRSLMRRRHKIALSDSEFGGYQGIWLDYQRRILFGASESRKDGCAIGY